MHSAVLQNKKYVKFAAENTVEVLALQRLDEGIQKGDPKAAKYKGKDEDGNEVELMVNWPNLTFEQIQELSRSKAGTYNDTGGIPYTAFVNPHTLEKISFLKGGSSASQVMEAAEEAKKMLEKEHGKGLSRDLIGKTREAISKAKAKAVDQDWDAGIAMLEKVGLGNQKTHEVIAEWLKTANDEILASARMRLDEIKAMEAKDQKKELNRFKGKNKKTGLEDEAKELLAAMTEES